MHLFIFTVAAFENMFISILIHGQKDRDISSNIRVILSIGLGQRDIRHQLSVGLKFGKKLRTLPCAWMHVVSWVKIAKKIRYYHYEISLENQWYSCLQVAPDFPASHIIIWLLKIYKYWEYYCFIFCFSYFILSF